jgi:integrase
MAKLDPAGQEYTAEAYVFGECGARVKNTKRAWLNAWARAGISDLHFHDLRHEAGSRLLEAGWPIHHVKEMLGHANVSQTSTYLNAGKMGLHDSMQRFDGIRRNPVASEPDSEHPLTGDNEQTETQKPLVN